MCIRDSCCTAGGLPPPRTAFWGVQGGGSPRGERRGVRGTAAPQEGAGNCRKRWYTCAATHLALADPREADPGAG
eukprot:15473153-Alexandrium_andersonii.AAC.1